MDTGKIEFYSKAYHKNNYEIVQQLPYEKELCKVFDFCDNFFLCLDGISGYGNLLFELEDGLGFWMSFNWGFEPYYEKYKTIAYQRIEIWPIGKTPFLIRHSDSESFEESFLGILFDEVGSCSVAESLEKLRVSKVGDAEYLIEIGASEDRKYILSYPKHPVPDKLLAVNAEDEPIGYGNKLTIHKEGIRHRAFSLFIYDWKKNRMLLQKRASSKYHSGGLWSNSCCSHPGVKEDLASALRRRLKDELGIDIPSDEEKKGRLREVGSFAYVAEFGVMSENEIDHVFLWSASEEDLNFTVNESEAEDVRWVDLDRLVKWLDESPESFTAWFAEGLNIVLANFEKRTM